MINHCMSCGSPIKIHNDNSGNSYGVCTRCGANYLQSTNKSDFNIPPVSVRKKNSPYLIPVIIFSCVLAFLCVVYIMVVTGVFSTAKNESQTLIVTEEVTDNTDNSEEKLSTDAVLNIEKKVENIRELYYATQDVLSNLHVDYVGKYAVYSDSSGNVKKVDFEFPEDSYTANYYYENGELYFAFIFDGTVENRFYIYEGTVFRWIDTDDNIIDNGFQSESYMNWYEMISNEDINLRKSIKHF